MKKVILNELVIVNLHNHPLNFVCSTQMTIHYQTLREYNKPMTVDGVSVEMDVAVTLVGVQFPPDNVRKFISFILKRTFPHILRQQNSD